MIIIAYCYHVQGIKSGIVITKIPGLKQILRAGLVSLLVWLVIPVVSGQGSSLRENYPERYTVAAGDTLCNIASQFLQDPERWPDVWQPDEFLDNSDLIYPGDVLRVNLIGGVPRILLTRGDRTEVNLSPEIREVALPSAIPEIPLEAIENSLTRNRIATQAEFEAAPYIASNVSNNLAIGTGDEVYARGVWPTGTTSFEVYRAGRQFVDDSGDVELGLELEYLGFASIAESVSADLKRILINNSSNEIQVGDRLLIREQSRIDTTIFPTQPSSNLSGRIIAFLGNESLASQLDTVVIDLGLTDNLAIGDILSIQLPGQRVVDEIEPSRMTIRERFRTMLNADRLEIPGKEVGTLLVYRTFEQLSYAVIISSTEPAKIDDLVVGQ